MRKNTFLFFIVVVAMILSFSITGCRNNKPLEAVDSVVVDTSRIDTSATDTMDNIIAETPMPKAADELFDDFIFNFAANRKLQFERIDFPLQVYHGKQVKQITKNQWTMERFFMRQEFYTLIFDNAKQMKAVKDTTIDHVAIEKIYFKTNTIKEYIFERVRGQWRLTSIVHKPMQQSLNASFLRFYHRFVTDSTFQISSVNDPLQFTGPDPDDDFSIMNGTLEPEQWSSFAPQLPSSLLYNIQYTQSYKESREKRFVIRGIANGLETELTFKRIGNSWKLVKLSM